MTEFKQVSVSRQKAIEVIKATNGTYFSVLFIKRTNDEKRYMNCRINVSAYVKGVGLSFIPAEKGLIPVHEAGKEEEGYRFVSEERILWVRHGGIQYNVKET